MANPVAVTLQLAAAQATGIALAQQPLAAGNLVLNGALVSGGVATMDVARRVLLASSGNDAAVVFTVYGTDRYSNVISEAVTGLNGAATAYTNLDFKTVTRIAASAAAVGNITAGTNGVGSSPWFAAAFTPVNQPFSIGIGVRIVTGAATYSIERTYDDPNAGADSPKVYGSPSSIEPGSNIPPIAWPDAVINGLSAAQSETNLTSPVFAWRLTVSAGVGQVQAQGIQIGT